MALAVAPQRIGLQDLEELMEEDGGNQRILLIAVLAARQRQRREQNRERRERRWWCKPWVERRIDMGQYHKLFTFLDREFNEDYQEYLRVDRNLFGEILQRVAPRITKSDRYEYFVIYHLLNVLLGAILHICYSITYFLTLFPVYVNRVRTPLEPAHKLVITLRFLATGDSYRGSMRWSFCVPHNTISILVREVCTAINEEYKQECFSLPANEDEWRQVAQGFADRWNFQHCLGAVDGEQSILNYHLCTSKYCNNNNYKYFCSTF